MGDTVNRIYAASNKMQQYQQFGNCSRKMEVETRDEIRYLLMRPFVTDYLKSINMKILNVYFMGRVVKVDYMDGDKAKTINADLFSSFFLGSEAFFRVETINDIVHG